MNATITLNDYLAKGKTFVIPKYQRGYVWGKKRKDGTDSVTYILDDLINKFRLHRERDVFLQGVTVCEQENENSIILVDGQQRTTFLYFLLKSLGYSGKFELHYEVRRKSNDFLESLIDYSNVKEDGQEEYQDIHFFKKTIRLIRDKVATIGDISAFLGFLLYKVKFLYIVVQDESDAMATFAMMNGNRAEMLPEEVIKAELLRLVSLGNALDCPHDEEWLSREWESNIVRGQYAREWDKWLQWWNRDDVRNLYRCKKVMGLLVSTYAQMKNGESLSLEAFKSNCLANSSTKDAAAIAFEGLRKMQKRFEDAFNKPKNHNLVGLVLRMFDGENGESFIRWHFANGVNRNLEVYADIALLGLTAAQCAAIADAVAGKTELEDSIQTSFDEKYSIAENSLSDPLLFLHDKEFAMRWLLRLNVYEDCKLNRFFDFGIWEKRSLEHICPKSRVGHKNENGEWVDGNEGQQDESKFLLMRDDIEREGNGTTEHGIGNLVLCYKKENTELGAKSYEEKIARFFNPRENFKSRHLIHTVSVFAIPSQWDAKSIAKNRQDALNRFEETYKGIMEPCNAQ